MKKIITLAFFLLVFSSPTWAADSIRIGLVGPFSGAFAQSVSEVRQALEMITIDENRNGVVGGRRIELIIEDDGGTPEGAVAAAHRLVKAGVVAVVGSLTSACTEVMQPIFDDAHIVQITYASTAVSLTEKGMKYFFRICPRDDEQGRAAARVIDKMNLSRLALLHDNTPYAAGLADEIRKRTLARRISVVYDDALIPGKDDYTELLKQIRKAEPNIIFYAGYYPEAARLLKNRHDMNWPVTFMGGDGSNNPQIVDISGRAAAEGYYIISPPMPEDIDIKQTKAFMARFKRKFGNAPASINTLLAADALTALINGIRKVRTTDPNRLAAFLHNEYRNPGGMTGLILFNAKGDRMTDLHGVYRINGQGHFILQRLLKFGQMIE